MGSDGIVQPPPLLDEYGGLGQCVEDLTVQELVLAAYMYSGLPCSDYRKAVLIHPTISELMPWILDTLQPVAT